MNNGKVRIYELSKELNLDNKDIKEICEQLNIAVKSHSSTITASQAERVIAVAAKSLRAEKKTSNVPKQELKSPKAPAKRKQQILAVHHKTDAPTPPSQPKRPNLGGTPKLVSPPNRPTSSAARAYSGNTPAQPDSSQKQSLANGNEPTAPVAKERQGTPSIIKPKPPKLSSPPSRSGKTIVAKKSSIQPPIKPKIRSADSTQSRGEETEKKKKVIPPLPTLNHLPLL